MSITRTIRPSRLSGLLLDPPRANLACVVDGRIDAFPVALRFAGNRYLIGVPPNGPPLSEGQTAKLLVDDGYHYFELHGTWVRGRLSRLKRRPPGAAPGLRWFDLLPEKTVAWHYGSMRERGHGRE